MLEIEVFSQNLLSLFFGFNLPAQLVVLLAQAHHFQLLPQHFIISAQP